MIQDFIKRYSFTALIIVIIGSFGYGLWWLYDTVYDPLFLQATDISRGQTYKIPQPAINQATTLLDSKAESTVDPTTITNPLLVASPKIDATTPPITASTQGIQVQTGP